jgi:transposase, IS5 family
MIRYNSQHQLHLLSFETPFEQNLLPDNRWVILSKVMPWDEMAKVYHRQMSSKFGRGSLSARLVIGVLIIKHMLKLDDREVLSTLQENVYLQYFVGFSCFQTKIAFDPSLLVTIRKRMGASSFDEWTLSVISKIEQIALSQNVGTNNEKEDNNPSNLGENNTKTVSPKAVKTIPEVVVPIALCDTLIIDTTVAEQKIKYPTDLDLLDKVRTFSEGMIDDFYAISGLCTKPRTYRNTARKDYLNAALKRKKSSREVRKAIKKQLGYIYRNINTINELWDILEDNNLAIPLNNAERKKWFVCQEIYRQQQEMITRNVKFCEHRIVSIEQPHVRPILRGKASKSIEFGSKIALSVVNGTNRVFKISWDAYNDGIDLEGQVEAYKKQYGKYPKLVLADKIYMTKSNRNFLKKLGIQHRGEPLGRKPKDQNGNVKASYTKLQLKEGNQRNHVEGQFGTAKEAYGLNKVKAKTAATAESWIANIFFVLNIVKLLKVARSAMLDNFCALFKFFKFNIFCIIYPFLKYKKFNFA